MVLPDAYIEPKSPGAVERLIRALRNRRAQRRTLKEGRIFLFSGSKYLSVAILIDESEGGAQLWCHKPRLLAQARYVLDHTTGEVAVLEKVWRAGQRGGYRIARREQLDVYTPHPQLEHVRTFWARMAGPSFH